MPPRTRKDTEQDDLLGDETPVPPTEDVELPDETPEPTPQVAQADPEWVVLKYPHVARGQLATTLLKTAEELGVDPLSVRSQSDGFKVPYAIAKHLWPSDFGGTE